MTSRARVSPIDERLAEIEAMEPARHAAEVRRVAGFKDNLIRAKFLQGVEAKRGKAAADRLRRDVWRLMQGVGVPG
jgi:hypothetical protein